MIRRQQPGQNPRTSVQLSTLEEWHHNLPGGRSSPNPPDMGFHVNHLATFPLTCSYQRQVEYFGRATSRLGILKEKRKMGVDGFIYYRHETIFRRVNQKRERTRCSCFLHAMKFRWRGSWCLLGFPARSITRKMTVRNRHESKSRFSQHGMICVQVCVDRACSRGRDADGVLVGPRPCLNTLFARELNYCVP